MRVSQVAVFSLYSYRSGYAISLETVADALRHDFGFLLAPFPPRYVCFPVFKTGRGPVGGVPDLRWWRNLSVGLGSLTNTPGDRRIATEHFLSRPDCWFTVRRNRLVGGLCVVSATEYLDAMTFRDLLQRDIDRVPFSFDEADWLGLVRDGVGA